jgi:hypothetical protein
VAEVRKIVNFQQSDGLSCKKLARSDTQCSDTQRVEMNSEGKIFHESLIKNHTTIKLESNTRLCKNAEVSTENAASKRISPIV